MRKTKKMNIRRMRMRSMVEVVTLMSLMETRSHGPARRSWRLLPIQAVEVVLFLVQTPMSPTTTPIHGSSSPTTMDFDTVRFFF
jgi:hypothetical protein